MRFADLMDHDSYLANDTITKKLHIGCGNALLDGWLNTDLSENMLDESIFPMDATKRFPFKDSIFTFIYTEHMIEHLIHTDALFMLKECYRVLLPGGRIRIATPDFQKIISIYTDKSNLHSQYVEWAHSWDRRLQGAVSIHPLYVVNNFFRAWGHKFLYDKEVLVACLEKCGFSEIKEVDIGKSSSIELNNLENRRKMPKHFYVLETMVFEAIKA